MEVEMGKESEKLNEAANTEDFKARVFRGLRRDGAAASSYVELDKFLAVQPSRCRRGFRHPRRRHEFRSLL